MKIFQTVVIFSNNITEDILDKEISRYEMLLQSFSKTKKVRTIKLGKRILHINRNRTIRSVHF